jgi:hypothetical protein
MIRISLINKVILFIKDILIFQREFVSFYINIKLKFMNFLNNENLINNKNLIDYKNLDLPVVYLNNRFLLDNFKLYSYIDCSLELGFTYQITVTYNGQVITKNGVPFPSLLFYNKDASGVNKVELLENDSKLKVYLSNISIEYIQDIKVDLSEYGNTLVLEKEQIALLASCSDIEKEACLNQFKIMSSIYFERFKLTLQIIIILKYSDVVLEYFKNNVKSINLNNFKLECVKIDV